MADIKFSNWLGTTLPAAGAVDGKELQVIIQGGVPKTIPINANVAAGQFQTQNVETPVVVTAVGDSVTAPTNWFTARTLNTGVLVPGNYDVAVSVLWKMSDVNRLAYFRGLLDGSPSNPNFVRIPYPSTEAQIITAATNTINFGGEVAHTLLLQALVGPGGGMDPELTVLDSRLSLTRVSA